MHQAKNGQKQKVTQQNRLIQSFNQNIWKTKMKFAFITVNYNNYNLSINFVSSIMASKSIEQFSVDIIIVDNQSKNDEYTRLKEDLSDYANVKVIQSKENKGYFNGLNCGITQIDTNKYDYIIGGNNDIIFDRDFLLKLSRKDYPRKNTVIVPDVETITGVHQNPQYINIPSKMRRMGMRLYYSCYLAAITIDCLFGFIRRKRKNNRKNKIMKLQEIFLCTGAIFLFRKDFFNHCGKLDDSVFLWGEEAVLAHQLYTSGDKMLYDPELHVTHLENATVKRIASRTSYKLQRDSYKYYKNFLDEDPHTLNSL